MARTGAEEWHLRVQNVRVLVCVHVQQASLGATARSMLPSRGTHIACTESTHTQHIKSGVYFIYNAQIPYYKPAIFHLRAPQKNSVH